MKTLLILLALLSVIPVVAQECAVCGNIPLIYGSKTIMFPPNTTVKSAQQICKKSGLKFVKDSVLEDQYYVYDTSCNPAIEVGSIAFFEKRLESITCDTVFSDSVTAEQYRKSIISDYEEKTGCKGKFSASDYGDVAYRIIGSYCAGKPRYITSYHFYFDERYEGKYAIIINVGLFHSAR